MKGTMTTAPRIIGRRPRPRGFAALDPRVQRKIASKGGVAAHEGGRAHEFTPAEARRAGQKGGRAVSRDREHMARIGRAGGFAAQKARRKAKTKKN